MASTMVCPIIDEDAHLDHHHAELEQPLEPDVVTAGLMLSIVRRLLHVVGDIGDIG
jgi:hypothetical protein